MCFKNIRDKQTVDLYVWNLNIPTHTLHTDLIDRLDMVDFVLVNLLRNLCFSGGGDRSESSQKFKYVGSGNMASFDRTSASNRHCNSIWRCVNGCTCNCSGRTNYT